MRIDRDFRLFRKVTIMGILQIIVVIASIAWMVVADDSCPSAEDLSPCTCDGEGLNCMADVSVADIKKAFSAKFKYGGVRAIWIQGTQITDIPGDLLGNVKSQQIYIELNSVSSVDLDAFSASKKTLQTLSLFGNKLESLDYSDFGDFENLGTLNLGRNQITSIPNSAFSSNSLSTIILAQNKITEIGMNAFSNMPNLAKIELSWNQIAVLGPMAFAMRSHAPQLEIDLTSNSVAEVSGSAFQGAVPLVVRLTSNKLTSLPKDPFERLITSIGQKGGIIDVHGNPFSCEGCDYSWILRNQDLLYDKFVGFTCVNGKTMNDLTKQDIKCNN